MKEGLGKYAVVHDVDDVSVHAQGDLRSGQFGADFHAVPGQAGGIVGVEGEVNLDHRVGGQLPGPGR